MSFGPVADVMRQYFIAHAQAVRSPKGKGFYGAYPPEVVEQLDDMLDKADALAGPLGADFRARIQREKITLKAFSNYSFCRALTARYAETRNETDRVKAAKAVNSAMALFKAIKDQDVIWVAEMLGGPYRHYYYMNSIVTDPPRTRFEEIGEFDYYYDSMYEGPTTLADAVELKNVIARRYATHIRPGADGELVFEFLAPENAIFESVKTRLSAHSVPTNLATFSVELSVDAGKSWELLTDKQADTAKPMDLTSKIKGKESFVLRYRGKNDTEEYQKFVDCPKVSVVTIAAAEPVQKVRYWDKWDEIKATVPSVALDLIKPKLTDKLVLFEYEPDLGYWGGGYHQPQEYYVGKGVGDNSCVRMWENEGPGWSGIAGIPTEPGAKYLLTFHLQVQKGKVVIATEGNWKPGWPANVGELARTYRHMQVLALEEHWKRLPLSKRLEFEPSKEFKKVELEIEIPDKPIDPDNSSFTIVLAHKGDGSEFFVDDVVLYKQGNKE